MAYLQWNNRQTDTSQIYCGVEDELYKYVLCTHSRGRETGRDWIWVQKMTTVSRMPAGLADHLPQPSQNCTHILVNVQGLRQRKIWIQVWHALNEVLMKCHWLPGPAPSVDPGK